MWPPYIDFTMVKTLLTNLVSKICNIFVAEAVNAGKLVKSSDKNLSKKKLRYGDGDSCMVTSCRSHSPS